MKIILFASALALSTAAIAQDTTAPATPPATPDATQPAMPPATPDASAPAAAPDASAPAAAPDASAMPAAPAAGDAGNASGAQQQAQSTDDSNLPACSKSVTDKCVQKGGSGHHAAHKGAMHHKKK